MIGSTVRAVFVFGVEFQTTDNFGIVDKLSIEMV